MTAMDVVKIQNFIEWLKGAYSHKGDCEIMVLYEYDSIEAPDGRMGFGVYVPEEKMIYVAGDIPDAEHTVPQTIAHEYAHFLQDMNGKPYDEEAADLFADDVLELYSAMNR